MAGLTSEGFTPETLEDIQDRIMNNLNVLSPGFDFSPESPDGQLLGILSYEISAAWNELAVVYKAYDPSQATGAALRNLGVITGILYGAATRSQATVTLDGVTGTIVPAGSLVADAAGNDFATQFDATVPSSVLCVSTVSGKIPVLAGTLVTAKTVIVDWTGVTQALDGIEGDVAQSETAYRNLRNRTVLRNYTSTDEAMSSRLYELGLEQVSVYSNETTGTVDGVPANTIHVTVSPTSVITDEDIARVILNTKPAACATHGATNVVLDDTQGVSHSINFTEATEVPIFISADVTYLDEENAGAKEAIEQALIDHINALQVDEDVIYSRLFGVITPYGKAQVNSLTIGLSATPTGTVNLPMSAIEAASTILANVIITET